ncbi:hypothetical protein FBUS_04096 [Fasciolopsis buskii]|uniref:Uncharacterized protein n=1 Tax=Fasciolopsis buskii TaxID=27845 RepID=A0A8E0S664_9TREM|nr:hypothetical protein FBUS_04096 [Fasciolopsis buski]
MAAAEYIEDAMHDALLKEVQPNRITRGFHSRQIRLETAYNLLRQLIRNQLYPICLKTHNLPLDILNIPAPNVVAAKGPQALWEGGSL